MMRFLAFALMLLSFNSFAQTTYIGNQRGSNSACFLHIKNTYYIDQIETAANFRADIVLEFQDGAHGGGHNEELDFTIAPTNRNDVLSGTGLNGKDQANIFVTPRSSGLSLPLNYAVKFLHGSHFHSTQCLNLKLQ
jgi:hypothetical protein